MQISDSYPRLLRAVQIEWILGYARIVSTCCLWAVYAAVCLELVVLLSTDSPRPSGSVTSPCNYSVGSQKFDDGSGGNPSESDEHEVTLYYDRRRLRPAAQRKGPRNKAERERERRERVERTNSELDSLYADYFARVCREECESIGVIYARYSTRYQDSIADQVRAILESAVRLKVFIPRENIFYDLAVRGVTKNREGLAQAEAKLKTKRATTLLLFSTSRLFRKQYRTLEFVDRIHKQWGVRCVFVKSGIDTNSAEQWEMRLSTLALVDQFVVTMNVSNIQASHQGLLAHQMVCGHIPYGYTGIPVEGIFTKLGRPRRRIEIDPVTGPIVVEIFNWYLIEELSINAIVHRLNTRPDIPLPDGAVGGQWNRRIVARLLRRCEYRGDWKYGASESVYLPEADYTRHKLRDEPLMRVQLDELRIVPDELFYAVQARLATPHPSTRGRKAKDGTSRSKLMNEFYFCPKHDRLHVSGTYSRYMHCPTCNALPWEERTLVSDLKRELSQKLIVERLAVRVRGDEQLLQQTLDAFTLAVEAAQRPDPACLLRLRVQIEQLNRSIELTRRTSGETEGDQAEAARLIRDMQNERSGIQAEAAVIESALGKAPKMPTEAEVRALINHLSEVLSEAAGGKPSDAAAARKAVEMLTGGRIELHQMGERKRQRGWLQARFCVRLLPYLTATLTGVPAVDDEFEEVVDLIAPLPIDEQSERAWELAQKMRNKDVARELDCCLTYVATLLKHAYAERGMPYEEGRARWRRLQGEAGSQSGDRQAENDS